MELKSSLVDGEVELYSSDILQDLFDGYIKPEEILNKQEDIKDLHQMIETINNLISNLENYIEEM